MVNKTLAAVGRLLPRKQVRRLGVTTTAAGFDINPEVAAGYAVLIPIIIFVVSLAVFFALQLSPLLIVLAAIGATLIISGGIYETLLLRIDSRRKAVEIVLPDFLQLAAANIRAGMALDKSLWYAAKPEFGILAKEMELASKRVFSGETLEGALEKLADRFQSRYLTRTVDLIKEGVVSGGEMAGILEKTAVDLRNMQLMQKEISASMVMYSIFIAFAAAIGAPFLYVVSHKLVELFQKVLSRVPLTGEGVAAFVGGIRPVQIGIAPAEFALFAATMVTITGVIACMMMSVIQSGRKRDAIKYIIPFIIVALGVFYVGRWIIDYLFAGFTL